MFELIEWFIAYFIVFAMFVLLFKACASRYMLIRNRNQMRYK